MRSRTIRQLWRRSALVRGLAVAYLIVVAALGIVIGIGMLSNLFVESRDNAVGVYLLIGLPALALGVASLATAAGIWRDKG